MTGLLHQSVFGTGLKGGDFMSNANRATEQQQITQVYRELSPSDKVVFETVLNLAFVLLKSLQQTKDIAATQKEEG